MKGRRRQKVQAQATLTKYLGEEESGGEERGCGRESRATPQDSGLVSREKGKKVVRARDDSFTYVSITSKKESESVSCSIESDSWQSCGL